MACPLPAARLQGVRDEGDRRAGRITLHDIGPSTRRPSVRRDLTAFRPFSSAAFSSTTLSSLPSCGLTG